METIIEFRAYAATKAAFDAKRRKDASDTPLMTEVKAMALQIEKDRRAHG